MRTMIVAVALSLVAQSFAAAAEPPAKPLPAGVLKAAVAREGRRAAADRAVPLPRASQSGAMHKRHPVMFAALLGAGGGAVFANSAQNELMCHGTSNDCLFPGPSKTLVGAGIGAGIGALVGLAISHSHK